MKALESADQCAGMICFDHEQREAMKTVLVVDDDSAIRLSLRSYFGSAGHETIAVSTLGEARQTLMDRDFDAVLLDVSLPDGDGVDFLSEIRERDPSVPVIVMTGQGTIPMAVQAMRRGADHFLTKPVDLKEVEVYLSKALQIGSIRRANRALKERPAAIVPYFGKSLAWRAIEPFIEAACKHRSPILIRGETGTGKGLLARHIHGRSLNAREPFVELNCAAFKGEFLETELFGHTKGAFTGAVEAKEGLLERAHRGTLFLDEVGDMDLTIQSKFLKVLEEKRYRPLGRVEERISDFRLICATNQDLEKRIEAGTFRKDLYFRINTLVIALPPLRERLEDLPALTSHILAFISGGRREPRLAPDVLTALSSYPWPGNLRELHNVLERAWILSDGKEIGLEHVAHLSATQSKSQADEDRDQRLGAAERRHILDVLKRAKGRVPEAAKALGVSRPTLYRKISEHKIDLKELR
jgi:DNA-binding NtrC family response regulator